MISKSLQSVLLVIEDDELMQDLIRTSLAHLGVDIISAYNGEDGYYKYRQLRESGQRPAMVIIDIHMPLMDGIETTKRIMEYDPSANIIGFTAFYGTERTKQLKAAGAKKVIPRSIGFKVFRNMVHDALLETGVAASALH